jgi:ABC-type branched-subunit amino acid transport system ATPase component
VSEVATPVLEARKLSAGYGRVPVVRDLDLHVAAGEVVSLVGPNGAGKTTTLLALAGELPPLGGDVRMHGDVVTAPLHRRARQGLSFVTEERSVLRYADRVYVMRRGHVEISGKPRELADRLADVEDSYLGRTGPGGPGQ